MGFAYKPNSPDDPEHQRRLRELLDEAGTVMMITRTPDGALHGRPMAVARVEDDGTMYFATTIKSTKIEELQADPRIDLVFQGKTAYATVAGRARISRERKLIDELWTDAWKVWFPDGKDDPDIAIVVADPERGEYWDQTGTKGLSFLFRTAKAFVTGTEVETKPGDHATVRM